MTFKKGTALCYGMAVCDVLIPGLPRDAFSEETTRIPRFYYSTGGDAMNEAVALVKLGQRSHVLLERICLRLCFKKGAMQAWICW